MHTRYIGTATCNQCPQASPSPPFPSPHFSATSLAVSSLFFSCRGACLQATKVIIERLIRTANKKISSCVYERYNRENTDSLSKLFLFGGPQISARHECSLTTDFCDFSLRIVFPQPVLKGFTCIITRYSTSESCVFLSRHKQISKQTRLKPEMLSSIFLTMFRVFQLIVVLKIWCFINVVDFKTG